MKKFLVCGLLLLAGLLGTVSPALADWIPGDSTKWVQMPNPNGYNVNTTNPYFLADDFLCTRTGPITDVHIWGSYVGDVPDPTLGVFLTFWSDSRPPGTYSRPNAPVWEGMYFSPGSYSVVEWGTSNEQFFDPPNTIRGSDNKIFLYNFFINPSEAFVQQAGNIYWLSVIAFSGEGQENNPFGWKTSMNPWGDDAVWTIAEEWYELRDPVTGDSLDLAFAITTVPLPGSLLLLGTGLLGVLGLGWRRRA